MAIKGLSTLVVAAHTTTNNQDTYSNVAVAGKMVSYSCDIEVADASELYADDEVCERDGGGFSNGTLTLETCDLGDEITKTLLSVTEHEATISGTGDSAVKVKEVIYDDDTKGNEVGVGVVETHQEEGETYYKAVWFPKVQFDIPAGSAETKGESISWQTPEISGTIMRGDTYSESTGKHPWKITAKCATLADAKAFLLYKGSNDTIYTPAS